MTPATFVLCVTLGIFLVAGAAAQEGPADPGRQHRHRGPGGLFVSPCGRPYRAGPGEPYPVATWFAEADTNHDGTLDRSEFRADALAFFAVLDRNGDGVIDNDEVTYYERNIVPEILRGRPEAAAEGRIILAQFGGGSGGGGGGGGGGRGGGRHSSSQSTPAKPQEPASEMIGAAPYGLLAEPEPVTAADTDFNERITKAEFLAAADRHFEALDVKGAGKIALEDLPKTAMQRGPRNPGAGV